MDARLDVLAASQGGVFTSTQAIACGYTRGQLRTATKNRQLYIVRRGVLTCAEYIEGLSIRGRHRLDVAAALLNRNRLTDARNIVRPAPRLAVGHLSAGLLWNLAAPLPASTETEIGTPPLTLDSMSVDLPIAGVLPRRIVELVSADRCRRTYRCGVHVVPADLPAGHTIQLGGIPVTTPARTAMDLIRELPWPQAIVVADRALKIGATRRELVDAAEHCRLWRGGKQGVRAAAFADRRAESPAESRARAVFVDLGLPPPELQVDIHDNAGLVARVDFLFREFHTVVEIDGKVKYTDPIGSPGEVLWREKLREDRLRDAGYEVVRVTWAQLLRDPEGIKARILAAFARAMRRAA
ncbi:MAG: hypothetical protein ACT4P1_08765 [Sporichthyaceae bacterium]